MTLLPGVWIDMSPGLAIMQFMKTTHESLNVDLGFQASEWVNVTNLHKLTLELRIKRRAISDFPYDCLHFKSKTLHDGVT